jgi:hypothetical protein
VGIELLNVLITLVATPTNTAMEKRSLTIVSLLVLAVLFVIAFMFFKPLDNTETAAEPTNEAVRSPDSQAADSTEMRPRLEIKDETTPAIAPIREEDMTPFMKSEIAGKWIREMGYSLEDIAAAQQKIRDEGYGPEVVNDPGIIQRKLPPRHILNVSTEEILVPPEIKAGQPIPFTLKGTAPSPTFSFTHFDVLVQGEIIRIRAIGNSDADNEAGPGDGVLLDGQIDPLPPGNYEIVVPELGPMGSFKFIVTP